MQNRWMERIFPTRKGQRQSRRSISPQNPRQRIKQIKSGESLTRTYLIRISRFLIGSGIRLRLEKFQMEDLRSRAGPPKAQARL